MSKEIYLHSAEYAIENGERTNYFDSKHENERCKASIETAIRENFDGMHLDPDCVKPVLEKFGWERVRDVIAVSVQKLYWDGRFSSDNKRWARKIAEDLRNTAFDKLDPVTSHPAVFNGFIDLFRKEEESND